MKLHFRNKESFERGLNCISNFVVRADAEKLSIEVQGNTQEIVKSLNDQPGLNFGVENN